MSVPEKIGRFKIIREIGRGGMGIVWEGKDSNDQKSVAIKMLQSNTDTDIQAVQRFYREIGACQALSHRNIVPILEVGEEDGIPYYVMPLIKGSSLEEILKSQNNKISIRLAVHIAFQVALALAHAHQRNVIHRDIKPSNIMVTDEIVMVTDFGLARPEWIARLTTTGTILGTPTYMSPEQVNGLPYLDGRSDVYSLGVCLYEMLTGQPPFQANNVAQLLNEILHGSITAPHVFHPDIPQILSSITLKALARSTSERYQTAEELAEALRCFLLEIPISVTLPSAFYIPGWHWLRKHASIVIQLGLFFFFMFATFFMLRYQHEQKLETWRNEEKNQYKNRPPNPLYYVLPNRTPRRGHRRQEREGKK